MAPLARGVARAQRRIGLALAVASLLVIAKLTLTPTGGLPTRLSQWCIICGDMGVTDAILNLLLFVPLGAGLRAAGVPSRRGVPLAAGVSLAIELLQVRLITGRDASLGDLLFNTVGAAVGFALAASWRRWLLPPPAVARPLAVAALCAWLGVLAFTGWGVQRSMPAAVTYYGQWVRDFRALDRFPGRLLAARVNDLAVPDDAIPHSAAVRHALLRDSVEVSAVVTPGGPLPRGSFAPILGIAHPRALLLATLTQHGSDLVFSVRTNAAAMRLLGPSAKLAGVFADARAENARAPRAAGTVRLSGAVARGRLVVEARTDADAHRAAVRLGPAIGWSFLWPFGPQTAGVTRLLSAVWVAALLLPGAYWSRRAAAPCEGEPVGRASGTRAALAVGLVASLAAGLGAVPALFSLPATSWTEWLAAGGAAAAGWWLGRQFLARPTAAPGDLSRGRSSSAGR